jgi:hypothetical protein
MKLLNHRMAAWTLALLAPLGCSSTPDSQRPRVTVTSAEPTDDSPDGSGALCTPPPEAITFDAATGVGCKFIDPVNAGCAPGSFGYALVCLGILGAPLAPASLDCTVVANPGNQYNRVGYCCPCAR